MRTLTENVVDECRKNRSVLRPRELILTKNRLLTNWNYPVFVVSTQLLYGFPLSFDDAHSKCGTQKNRKWAFLSVTATFVCRYFTPEKCFEKNCQMHIRQ